MQIHIGRNGQSLGIFNEEQVRDGLEQGTFLGTDLAWQEGMGDWKPLSSFSILKSPPTLSQSPQPMHSVQSVTMSTEPPKSGLAVASMICGIASIPGLFCCGAIPLSLAAIICGHLALSDISKRPHLENSRGIAKAGLIMGYIMIAVAILLILYQIGMMGVSAVMNPINR